MRVLIFILTILFCNIGYAQKKMYPIFNNQGIQVGWDSTDLVMSLKIDPNGSLMKSYYNGTWKYPKIKFDKGTAGMGINEATESNSLIVISNTADSNIVNPPDGTLLHIIGSADGFQGDLNTRITMDVFSSTNKGANFQGRAAGGNANTPLAVTQGRILTAFSADGYNGTKFKGAALGGITIKAKENFTTTNTPTTITFSTTKSGDTTIQERVVLDETGLQFQNTTFEVGNQVDSLFQKGSDGKMKLTAFPTVISAPVTGIEAVFNGWDKNASDDFNGQYSSLTGIPTTFNPSAHNHVIADVTNLQAALDGKQPVGSYLTNEVDGSTSNELQTITEPTAGTIQLSNSGGSVTIDKSDVGLSNVPNTDATLRSNHTGTQTASTISDFTSSVRGSVSLTTNGTSGVATYNSGTGVLNIPNYTASSTPQVGYTSADVNSIVVTYAIIPNMSFSVTTGKRYKLSCTGTYQTAATTTGVRIKPVLTTATGTLRGVLKGAVSNANVATELAYTVNGAATDMLVTTGVATINTPHYWGADVIFDCTGSGTLEMQFGTEVAASQARILVGSTCILSEF